MIDRAALRASVEAELRRFPVVALTGSRQAGKTTMAKSLRDDAVYLDLELPSHRRRLAEPELFLRAHADRLVVLDEIQRVPDLFPTLRGLVDEDRRPGRFLVLGSAGPDLLRQSSESLAGRIAYLEFPPFGLTEVADPGGDADPGATRDLLWVRGGYPPSYLATTEEDSLAWRRQFLSSYVERDLPLLGLGGPPEQVRRLWTMLAHLQGQHWNAATIGASLGVTGPTTTRWLDFLVGACLVRRLPPLLPNLGKRLVKSPKVYVRDSGLAHALLGIADLPALLGHPVAGASFEGFVIEQILRTVAPGTDAAFFRTHGGAEIDLVLTGPDGARIAVEVKLADAPTLSRGFHEASSDLRPARSIVVVPGGVPYPLARGVDVVPLAALLADPAAFRIVAR